MQEYNDLPMHLDGWMYDIEQQIKEFKFNKYSDDTMSKIKTSFGALVDRFKANINPNVAFENKYYNRIKLSKQYAAIKRAKERIMKESKYPTRAISLKRFRKYD